MSKRNNIFLQIFFLLILPVIVLSLSPNSLKWIISFGIILTILWVTFRENISLKNAGIRLDNIQKSLPSYFLFTVFGIFVLFILAFFLHKQPLAKWWTYTHLQWFFLPISFIQEYTYRSLFQSRLQRVVKPTFAIFIIAILYSFLHILWNDPVILMMTFLAGLVWGYLWYKYPNLLLITLSHAILNFLAVYLGFFPWLVTQFFYLK